MRSYLLATIVGLAGLAVGASCRRPRQARTCAAGGGPGSRHPCLATRSQASRARPRCLSPSPRRRSRHCQRPGRPRQHRSGPASATATPSAQAASDLPNVDVAAHAVHAVPGNDDATAPTVTLQDRDGRTIKQLKADSGLAPGYVPSVGPGGARSYASNAPPYAGTRAPVMVPPVAGSQLGDGAAAECTSSSAARVRRRGGR